MHDAANIGEVEVDEAGSGDEVRDAGDALQEDMVGLPKGIDHADVAVREREQPVIRDHDERVDLGPEVLDARLRLRLAAAPLEAEWPRDDADGERAERTRNSRDYRCPTRARASAFPSGHEHHVGALQYLFDLISVILGGLLADLRIRAGAEAPRQLTADIEFHVGVAHEQGLRIGVHRDELDPLEPDLDHSVHGVHAAAADADNLDHCQIVLRSRHCCSSLRRVRSLLPARQHSSTSARCSGNSQPLVQGE